MLPVQAVNALEETKSVNEAEGFVSAEYGMVYPPGIPFLVPGEKITKTVLDKIVNAKKQDFICLDLRMQADRPCRL